MQTEILLVMHDDDCELKGSLCLCVKRHLKNVYAEVDLMKETMRDLWKKSKKKDFIVGNYVPGLEP